jgi:hypothetical protein
MKFKKISILIFLIYSGLNIAQTNISTPDAKGFFFTLGVGPRFPLGEFSRKNNAGPGVEASLSFTDINFSPLFFYTNFGFQNHSGNFKYYQTSDHSTLSSSLISINLGGKYFFKPMIDNVILLMPFVEGGFTYAYVSNFHQYKIDLFKNDDIENLHKFGFHIGGGLSFFLMEVIASYTYLQSDQYLSINLRLTLPVAATF